MTQLIVLGTVGDLPSQARMTGRNGGEVSFGLLSFFLLEDSTSDWHVLRLACQGRGEKEGLCVFVGVLRDWGS